MWAINTAQLFSIMMTLSESWQNKALPFWIKAVFSVTP